MTRVLVRLALEAIIMILIPFQEKGATRSGEACLDAELLASYMDGRTTPEERTTVEAHLAHCEDCYFAFSETLQAPQEASIDDAEEDSGFWRRLMSRVTTGQVAAGIAAAAMLVIVAQVYFGRIHNRPTDDLQIALNELDAAAGPYRQVEPRLSTLPTYRELKLVVRSAAQPGELPLALRDAASKVEKAVGANATGITDARALAAMSLTTGHAQQAVETLQPFESAQDVGVLNDLAAALLARRTGDDVKHALDLLERAVRIDPTRPEVWFNLGLAAQGSGHSARATEAWTQFLALDSTSGWAAEARHHLEKLNTK